MSNLRVSGGISINLLVNGDNLNTTLNSTKPLYQTFKKGTSDFSPNWETMDDTDRPIVFPRVYSVMESKEIKATNVTWKYNNVAMTFNASGVATNTIASGKVKQIDYNGSKALKFIGNVASDVNNDSDTITFEGNIQTSGQLVPVSAEITVLVEEASSNLYRLFVNMLDDVIDGDETGLTMTAVLYSSGVVVNDAQFEFTEVDGTVLRAKGVSPSFFVTRAMVDSELLVVCKAFIGNKVVAQEQRQVWDSTDPFTIICDQGTNIRQRAIDDFTYNFSLLNARTGSVVSGQTFVIKVYKNEDSSDITSQFTPTDKSITITGSKISQHKSLYVDASTTVEQ